MSPVRGHLPRPGDDDDNGDDNDDDDDPPPWQPSLLEHMTWSGHHVPGPSSDWDQPQYYFPTYENDNLLCGLEVSAVLSTSYLSVVFCKSDKKIWCYESAFH